jgi:hypothetical protein
MLAQFSNLLGNATSGTGTGGWKLMFLGWTIHTFGHPGKNTYLTAGNASINQQAYRALILMVMLFIVFTFAAMIISKVPQILENILKGSFGAISSKSFTAPIQKGAEVAGVVAAAGIGTALIAGSVATSGINTVKNGVQGVCGMAGKAGSMGSNVAGKTGSKGASATFKPAPKQGGQQGQAGNTEKIFQHGQNIVSKGGEINDSFDK